MTVDGKRKILTRQKISDQLLLVYVRRTNDFESLQVETGLYI